MMLSSKAAFYTRLAHEVVPRLFCSQDPGDWFKMKPTEMNSLPCSFLRPTLLSSSAMSWFERCAPGVITFYSYLEA